MAETFPKGLRQVVALSCRTLWVLLNGASVEGSSSLASALWPIGTLSPSETEAFCSALLPCLVRLSECFPTASRSNASAASPVRYHLLGPQRTSPTTQVPWARLGTCLAASPRWVSAPCSDRSLSYRRLSESISRFAGQRGPVSKTCLRRLL